MGAAALTEAHFDFDRDVEAMTCTPWRHGAGTRLHVVVTFVETRFDAGLQVRGEARAFERVAQKAAHAAVHGDEQARERLAPTPDVDAAWEAYYRHGSDVFLQGALMTSHGLIAGRESLG